MARKEVLEQDKDDNISKLTFEQAYSELEEIVRQLEDGQVELAESVKKYERGEKLKEHCSSLLKSAELKIVKLKTERSNIISGKDIKIDSE